MVGNGFTKSVLQVERDKCIEMCLNAALPYYNDITDPACPIPIYAGPIHLDRFLLVAESVNVRLGDSFHVVTAALGIFIPFARIALAAFTSSSLIIKRTAAATTLCTILVPMPL